MNNLNILDFYKDAAQTIIALHSSFPRKIEIYVEDLIGPDNTDEFGLHSKRHEACLGAFLWLAEEGYLRYQSTIRQEAIDQTILSSKSVVLLGRHIKLAPSPAQQPTKEEPGDQLPFIEHMRRAIQSQSSQQLSRVMTTFFEQENLSN